MQLLSQANVGSDKVASTPEEAVLGELPVSTLKPIAAKLETCLTAAYSTRTTGSNEGAKSNYIRWSTRRGKGYDYCATWDPIIQEMDTGVGSIILHCEYVDTLPQGVFPFEPPSPSVTFTDACSNLSAAAHAANTQAENTAEFARWIADCNRHPNKFICKLTADEFKSQGKKNPLTCSGR